MGSWRAYLMAAGAPFTHLRYDAIERWLRRTKVASMSVRGRCDNVGDDCGRAWSEVVRSLAMADYVSP